MGSSISNTRGFTLVEISIVMIIIGLLIGGTFGGMKLIENMQVNKTVQDLKAIETAALTFKDTYGRLPGDMPNTAARLPNCTVAPCSTGGNGNRALDNTVDWTEAINDTNEKFTFWHHLTAAGFIEGLVKPTTNMEFGEGSPNARLGTGGYRMTYIPQSGIWVPGDNGGKFSHFTLIVNEPSIGIVGWDNRSMEGYIASKIDRNIDDGKPITGKVRSNCQTALSINAEYTPDSISCLSYLYYQNRW